ncbi:hypothetical protein NFI96_019627, partial [Prochilodus magdalenae]
CQQEAKEAAQQGDLERSLELFRLAYELQPSAKLKKRIQQLQEALHEEEEEVDFINVNNSGLKLFKELYNKLYDHQKEGVAFLYSLHRDGRRGGILADDMGLGKTIQVISFLSGMYDAELANHTLLVMPTSLIKNWVREFAKWTPGIRVKEFHGSSKVERNRNLERVQQKGGAIITTYQMLINNWEQLAAFQQQEFCWDYVILDEAHKIKASSTKTAKCAHNIPARHRLLLTGTPVQNNLREMWALFDFACQGALLGTAKTFKTEYENPITRAREKDATPGEKALGLNISQNLMELIKPHFLRRTKAEVQHRKQSAQRKGEEEDEETENNAAEMPSLTRKNDLIIWTYLSPVQEDIYRQFLSLDHIKQLLTTTRSPLAELTVLKKLCDHPRLLSTRAVTQLGLEEGSAMDRSSQEDASESAASRIDHISDETLLEESGKLHFLMSLLERLREENHRTLIFSQSRKMLDIIERVLRNRNFRMVRVDGTVTQLAERERRITLFQTDRRYSVFLLTTQVGGVGITLTAANRVVIFDPSWNPATDAQAVDRAYRIGQTENVVIYRLITCGTVEEKIYRRQWCRTRLSWRDSEWQRVIFSDESRFSLGGDAQRIRVRRHRGQHQDERFVVTRPEGLVSLHLHPYRTICRNCVRMFKLHGMDYHRTPLGTSTAPYRDVWRVGLANTAAQRHTERQTSVFKDSLIRQTTGDKKNPFRYFSKQELKELFTLEDARSSSTQLQLQELHSQHRRSDPTLDSHIAELHRMEMFGISDHDLLFSKEAAADEDDAQDAESDLYIQTRVQKAQELVQAESELHGQLMDSGANKTEPAWLGLPKHRGLESSRRQLDGGEHGIHTHTSSFPAVVDLTQYSSDEPNEYSYTDEVEIISDDGEAEDRNHGVLSGGAVDFCDAEDSLSTSLKDSLIQGEESHRPHAEEHGLSSSLQELSLHLVDNLQPVVQEDHGNGRFHSPHIKTPVQLDSPKAPQGAEQTTSNLSVLMESFQGKFSLQLEDSVDMFSAREEEHEEMDPPEGEFQPQMDISGDTSANVKKDPVIWESEEEEEEEEAAEEEAEEEKPSLASSPLAGNFRSLGCSTPESVLRNGTPCRRGVNTSVASRRSFVESLLEDLEEEERDDLREELEFSQTSEASETSADESVEEEE